MLAEKARLEVKDKRGRILADISLDLGLEP
jgi:hypothetical protein